MVKNDNFLIDYLVVKIGQDWQNFNIATDLSSGHLVVKIGNFTLLLTSSGQ